VEKATEDDIPGDALRVWGEDSLKLLTQLINNMYEISSGPRITLNLRLLP